jgi:hypothetical protein
MGAQLAASIKFMDKDMSVTLLHDNKGIGHLNEQRLRLFDNIILVPENCYMNKGRKDYLKVKTHLYSLSPYDETIFIDADVLWLPRKTATELFDSLADVDFTMANRGCIPLDQAKNGFITWCNPEEIRAKYDIDGTLYNLSSEFIYFKKKKEVCKLFKQAQKNYETLKVHYVLFGNDIPDELPFAIAMMQTGIYPHKTPFLPFYWEAFHKQNLKPADMYGSFYAYSCGGCICTTNVKRIYDNLAQYYCNKMGLGKFFPLISKRTFLPERANI